MHSNRMRTVRSSGRISGSRGCTWSRGGGTWWGGYLVHGGLGGVPGPGGCNWSGGCTWSQGGVPGPRGCTWSRGLYPVPGGWYSPLCGQTHACKNITFATSLRTVINNTIREYGSTRVNNKRISTSGPTKWTDVLKIYSVLP